jgi:hypothetical protein
MEGIRPSGAQYLARSFQPIKSQHAPVGNHSSGTARVLLLRSCGDELAAGEEQRHQQCRLAGRGREAKAPMWP